MRKKDRQQLITRLLKEHTIRKQEDFVAILKDEDVAVTQATISRDIKEMKLIKVPALTGGYQYSLPAENQENVEERLNRLLSDGFVAVDVMEKFVYLKTLPGNAAAIAKLLQAQYAEELFSVINDDDGILLIVRTEQAAEDLRSFLMDYL